MIDFNDLIPKVIPAPPPIDFDDLTPPKAEALPSLDPNLTGTALMDEVAKGRRPEPVGIPEIADPQGLTGNIPRPKREDPFRALWQIPKGLAGGIEEMVGTAGTMMRAAAEKAKIGEIATKHINLPGVGVLAERIIRRYGPKAPMDFYDKQMKKYAKQGEKWADFWEEQANKGWEAPDPQVMQAKWREMPITKGAATISRAAPNYLAAIAGSVLTKSPQAGLVFISSVSGAGAYRRQRKAGAGVTKAQAIATMTGAWEYVTELVPFQELFKPSKSAFNKMFKLGTMEAAQEFVQGIGENFLEHFGYKAKDLKSVPDAVREGLKHTMDGWVDNVVAGAGLGVIGGGVVGPRIPPTVPQLVPKRPVSPQKPAEAVKVPPEAGVELKSIANQADAIFRRRGKNLDSAMTAIEGLQRQVRLLPESKERSAVQRNLQSLFVEMRDELPAQPVAKPEPAKKPFASEPVLRNANAYALGDKNLQAALEKAKATNPQETARYAREMAEYHRTDKGWEPEMAKKYDTLARNVEKKLIAKPEPAKVAKQPWEMTRRQYIRERSFAEAAQDLLDYKVASGIFPIRIKNALGKHKGALNTKQAKLDIADAMGGSIDIRSHKAIIKGAIEQGKPVSREVLEEYKSEEWARRALRAKLKKEVGISGRRKILQERIRRGEKVPAKLLEEYKSEKWAQEALAVPPKAEKVKEMPSESANAFEKPISSEQEFIQSKKDIQKKLKAKPGFAMIPSTNEFKEIGNKLKDVAKIMSKPQDDIITDVVGAIEKWRANTNLAGLYADWSQESLRKIKATAKQATDVDNWLDNPQTYQGAFDKLPDNIKELGKSLREDYERLKAIAVDNDILQTWVDNYTPHLYKDNWNRLRRSLWPVGGKLGTKFRHAKQRVFKTMDEAKKAGLHPITDPIVKNATYKYQLFKTLANKNLIETLKKMKREDGLPLIMGRPRIPEKLRIYEQEYEWVNVPGLQRFMYVGEAGEMPMLVRQSAKADPQIAKILNNVFAPWTPKAKWTKGYMWLRGRVKRLIMYNPLIHSWNIWSDVFDEVNFNPYSLVKTQLRGRKLYKAQDALVERAVAAGLQIQSGYGIAKDLRRAMGETAAWEFLKPLKAIEQWSDKHLWQGTVRNAQIGLFETLTRKIAKEQPNWSQDKVDRTVSTYINTLLGTIPHTWFSKTGREVSSALLFARNWTLSNIDMVVKAATYGRKGMGMKALSGEEQTRIGKEYQKHLLKGFAGLMLFSNMLQLAFLLITNKLKRDKIIKGSEVELHTTFQNEKKHWYDIDTGLDTKKGQRVYLVAPFFRYIRDYIGWASEPAKTLYNKIEPVLKNTVETVANYSVWQKKEISKKGTPTWKSIQQRMEYFVKGITPSAFFAGRPGYVPTKFEWLIPFSGTWIRRGAPGGKFTGLMWDFRSKQGYKKSKVDEKIDEYLQKGDFRNAVITMAKEKRYMTTQGMKMRILETIAPLNYYWRTSSKREKAMFLVWLRENGHSMKDLQKDLGQELEELSKRED